MTVGVTSAAGKTNLQTDNIVMTVTVRIAAETNEANKQTNKQHHDI